MEKFNNWSVSSRCKRQGMAWTVEGVNALALLEVSRRNGELAGWRESGWLPDWEEPPAHTRAA